MLIVFVKFIEINNCAYKEAKKIIFDGYEKVFYNRKSLKITFMFHRRKKIMQVGNNVKKSK